jgi:hypothetical protein
MRPVYFSVALLGEKAPYQVGMSLMRVSGISRPSSMARAYRKGFSSEP